MRDTRYGMGTDSSRIPYRASRIPYRASRIRVGGGAPAPPPRMIPRMQRRQTERAKWVANGFAGLVVIGLVYQCYRPLLVARFHGSGAQLRGADLQGRSLRGADLRDADLRRADLAGADLS